MKKKFVVLISILASFIVIYSQLKTDKAITYLKANLEYLASDELEGREITKHGEDLAALFIATELKKYGVEPYGDSGTYFQKIDIQLSSLDKKTNLSFSIGNKTYELIPQRDFLIDKKGLPLAQNKGENLEMVFANYGIVAEEYGIDDYKNLDVKGKAVVVLDDLPNDDRFTKGDEIKYGTWRSKREMAKVKGAAAVIIVLSEDSYSKWNRYSRRMFSESFTLKQDEENETGLLTLSFSKEAFNKFFQNEEVSFEDLFSKKENGEKVEPFTLKTKFNYEVFDNTKIGEAQNIVGLVKGTDPKLSKTFVAVTAHYDHLGITEEGTVYNGADDDGSGTVTILEAAREIASKRENKRSILFIWHTGEEKGLLGSKYLTTHTEYIDSIIADINMDMVGREDVDKIYCIGSGKLSTQYYNLVKDVNERSSNFELDYRFDADDDPNRFYYRSDHYQYAKRGIPVVFFFDDMTKDYHRPTDDVEKISFAKLKKMVILTSELALEISNLNSRLIIDKN